MRECYWCCNVVHICDVETLLVCSRCGNKFDMIHGKNVDFVSEESTSTMQQYVPKGRGILWKLKVFDSFVLGQHLTISEANIVNSRAKALLMERNGL